MNDPTRRGVLQQTAALGLAAALVPEAAAAQDEKKDDKKADNADRQRVLAVGMTEDEADCWELTGKAAGKFFSLPQLHPMDRQEVASAIHIIQNKLLSRPTYRRYLELAKKGQAK